MVFGRDDPARTTLPVLRIHPAVDRAFRNREMASEPTNARHILTVEFRDNVPRWRQPILRAVFAHVTEIADFAIFRQEKIAGWAIGGLLAAWHNQSHADGHPQKMAHRGAEKGQERRENPRSASQAPWRA